MEGTMDIGGINVGKAYLDKVNVSSGSASKLEQSMKGNYAHASDEELMDACKMFESYFVEQMYKSMVKTLPENEEMSGSTSTMLDFYKDQMIQEMATETTQQQDLGLAKMLYEQMKRNYGDVE